MKHRIVFSFLIFSLLLWPVPALSGDLWYGEYDAGVRAIAAKDWGTAEAKMKAALELQPKQGRRVLAYGVRFIRYIPEYYLGVVNFHQAKYQDALNQLQRVQNRALVVKGDPEFSQMLEIIQQATEKLNPKIEKKAEPVKPSVPIIQEPKVSEQQQEADLQAQRLEQEKRKREQFDDLMRKAEDALAAKDSKQSKEFAKQAEAMGIDETKVSELRKRIDLTEKLDVLTKAVRQAQRLAVQVASLDGNNPELVRLRGLIDQGIQDLEDRGLLAFLSGDYQNAIMFLERTILLKKDSAESWFYLGCSHASLGLLQGKEQLLQKAQGEFAQARKLNSKLAYSPALVSPRILEMYQKAR